MDNNIWTLFWKYLPIIREKMEPVSKRSGISADAAILLTVIYENNNTNLPIEKYLYKELFDKGLISEIDGGAVTGKGAILAKSFSEIRKTV